MKGKDAAEVQALFQAAEPILQAGMYRLIHALKCLAPASKTYGIS